MPTLEFKGKSHIYAHHLTVPYRPLIADNTRSIIEQMGGGARDSDAATSLDSNLIIHGDNLHALKALLPTYAGRVKCIYIDPPYNTGSQAWVFNDNVNSPTMRQWLSENTPVDGEDLERHDKWLCMMWPRLQLLRELLADDGVIFASIDDHEQWRLLGIMEEVFGESNFVATLPFIQNLGARPGKWMSTVHEYVVAFCKEYDQVTFAKLPTDEDPTTDWRRDDRGYFREGYPLMRTGTGAGRADRPEMFFPIYVGTDYSVSLERKSDQDIELLPLRPDGSEARWMWGKEKVVASSHDIHVKPHRTHRYQLITKVRPDLNDKFNRKPRTLWYEPR